MNELLSKFHGVRLGTTPWYGVISNNVWSYFQHHMVSSRDAIHGVVPNGTPYGVNIDTMEFKE